LFKVMGVVTVIAPLEPAMEGPSVGAWSVAPGKALPKILGTELFLEADVAITGSVVCRHASAGESEAGGVGAGHVEEALRRRAGLVGQDGGEVEATVVVDGDVQELVTGTSGFAGAIAVPRVA
jgi:hypothetical protein